MKKIVGVRNDPQPIILLKDEQGRKEWYRFFSCKTVNLDQGLLQILYKREHAKNFSRETVKCLVEVINVQRALDSQGINYTPRAFRKLQLPDLTETFAMNKKTLARKLEVPEESIDKMSDASLKSRGFIRLCIYKGELLYVRRKSFS